jgi:hypothetical protein
MANLGRVNVFSRAYSSESDGEPSHSKKSEDIDGAAGEQRDDQERDERLKHHSDFGPAGEDRGVGGGEGSAGVEGEEQIVHELGRPCWAGAGRTRHLGEEEGAVEIAARAITSERAAGVEFPIPEREDQDVGDPENAGGTEELFRRFEMKRQAVDEKEERGNEGDGQQGVGDEGEGAHHAEVSTAIRNDDPGEQDKNDCEKEPAGADGEAFGERPIKEAGGHHREEGRPARFVEFFLGHENSESEDRIILAAENVHRNLKFCAWRVGRGIYIGGG